MIAAVAESAPTTRCRDEPSSANSSSGTRIVYSPVMTGIPAIDVYPITSGIASAASVTPAMTSIGTPLRFHGSIPCIIGNRSTGLSWLCQ